ncbi:hypothetical protein FHG87_023302 [Trinorchestia longiramus]|nr:hypothetical protein FHG87_023302 [Trinorchestia longiramus]
MRRMARLSRRRRHHAEVSRRRRRHSRHHHHPSHQYLQREKQVVLPGRLHTLSLSEKFYGNHDLQPQLTRNRRQQLQEEVSQGCQQVQEEVSQGRQQVQEEVSQGRQQVQEELVVQRPPHHPGHPVVTCITTCDEHHHHPHHHHHPPNAPQI